MDFIYAQETLTTIQWIMRAIVSFSFLLLATKIMGRRSIAQLRLIDFTIALVLGNILAHPLSDEGLGLKGSLITTSVLVILYLACVFLSLKWNIFKNWLEPSPYTLIKNGEIHYNGISKARITVDHLLSEARKANIEEIQKVALALWEPDGSISFFLSPQLQALTPGDMQMIKKPFYLPMTIIKDGKVDYSQLQQSGKDISWLENKTSILNVNIHDILLATVDEQDELKVYFYK
ncbi:DUF421 domain-containing protein [Psychrobacillus sp. FSL H8-0483]|uniref:DUF421 domain-containing protein n=1 Tax=Psychrobacillus sp. FSL H8-0483 TaxID=2921389 RepID=UPI00315AA120